MIKVVFFTNSIKEKSKPLLLGFKITGHANFASEGSDIVCSAVSSAAYMAANTITEIKKIKANIKVSEGFMSLKITNKDAEAAADILQGFKLHIVQLEKQYENYVKVKYSEV